MNDSTQKTQTPRSTMSGEAQRIAIALSLGEWIWHAWGKSDFRIFAPKGIMLNWSGEEKETNSMCRPLQGRPLDEAARDFILCITPDYLSDLNAMHGAEKVLTDHTGYVQRLSWIVKPCDTPFFLLHATAAQRAEAFLRTLNLWVENQ